MRSKAGTHIPNYITLRRSYLPKYNISQGLVIKALSILGDTEVKVETKRDAARIKIALFSTLPVD